MSQQLFRGHVISLLHRIEGNGNPAAQVNVDVVMVDAQSITGDATAEVQLEAKPFTNWPRYGDDFFLNRQPDGTLEVGWQNSIHHDVEVAGLNLMHNMNATRLTRLSVAACPDSLRAEAERTAESMGVKLAWEETALCIITGRGTIRKHLDIPGMIDPELGWRKLLIQIGLVA